uniref:Uncharacterized protein n=1 Tax=Romanomermis culicivorax TaxID=13658 RepID=A0A915JTK6_ROMCU
MIKMTAPPTAEILHFYVQIARPFPQRRFHGELEGGQRLNFATFRTEQGHQRRQPLTASAQSKK